MSTGISSLVMDHVCPVENDTDARSSQGLSSMNIITSAEFIVPSLFSKKIGYDEN